MRRSAVLVISLAAAIASMGCQQLFTTSLASALARDSLTVPKDLSVEQATELAADAKASADPRLAASLLKSLNDQIAVTSNPAKKEGLQAAAASAAVTASEVGSTVMSVFSSFTSRAITPQERASPSSEEITDILRTIQAAVTDDILSALAYLPGISAKAATEAGFGGTDYFIAAVVVAASVLKDVGIESDPTADAAATKATIKAAADADSALQAKVDLALGLARTGTALLTEQGNTLAEKLSTELDKFLDIDA